MKVTRTITSIFMVPTLQAQLHGLKDNGFINGYINDESHDVSYTDAVYLLFRPKDIDKFRLFLDSEYVRTKSVIEDYDHPDGFVVVVYKLDSEYKQDFKLIKQGKYSKTSLKFQELFPRMVEVKGLMGSTDQLSLQYRIFNKTKDLIEFWEKEFDMTFDPEFEIWSKFDVENEVLNSQKLQDLKKSNK